MTLRTRVVLAIAVQSIGTVASFSTLLLIARLQGPAAQGQFAQVKAWVDLIVAVGCFGFSQSFTYVINRHGVSRNRLYRFSMHYALAFLVVAFPATLVATHRLLPASFQAAPFRAALLIAVAVSGIVLHELWRGVYLTYEDGPRFSLMTILQAVGLLLAVLAASSVRSERYDVVYLAAAAVCVVVNWTLIRTTPAPAQERPTESVPWGVLLHNGLQVFLQNMLGALQPAMTFWLIRTYGGGNEDVGWFQVGLYVYTAFALPLQMVSPIFFNRWSRELSPASLRPLLWLLLKGGAGVLVLSIALLVPLRHVVIAVFGPRYAPAVEICQTLLLAAAPLVVFRVLIPIIHCSGLPQVNTIVFLARLSTIGALLYAFSAHGVTRVASIAWTASELVAASAAALFAWRLSLRSSWSNAASPDEVSPSSV